MKNQNSDETLDILIERVKKAFKSFATSNRETRKRAKLHGEELIALKTHCDEKGLRFTIEIKKLEYSTSTIYNHITLAKCWDRAEAMAKTMGVEFDQLTLKEVVELVRTPKRGTVQTAGSAAEAKPGADKLPAGGTADPDDGEFGQNAPPLPAAIQKLIDKGLVQVIYAERGRPTPVQVGSTMILVRPY